MDKYIYPLGGGCFPYGHIRYFDYLKPYLSKYNLFKGSKVDEKYINYFLPLELINGNIEKYFYDDKNWEIFKLPYLLSDSIVDIRALNIKTGLHYGHVHKFSKIFIKNIAKEYFDFFNKNKYNLLYIIDFQRGNYQFYKNEQLLQFEKFLIDNNYNLNNFIYIDIKNHNTNRYDNTKIECILNDPIKLKHDPEKCNSCAFFMNYKDYIIKKLKSL